MRLPGEILPLLPRSPELKSTDTTHTNTLTQHLPFTAALLSHLSPVLPLFPGAACSAVKAAEAHSNKYCNSHGPQDKWASFHNSSSPLCTTLLYWPIFYCWLQQSKLKQHRSNCIVWFGFQGLVFAPSQLLSFLACRAMSVTELMLWIRCIILHQHEKNKRYCVVTLRQLQWLQRSYSCFIFFCDKN